MTTLLDHTGLPLWVYIVLITVGSLLLLATIAVSLRCWVLRRRATKHNEFDSYTGGPMRRVTVRRGRVVPTSQHLSLTGSKFGMRQFGQLADNESTVTGSGRRSPFEWWNTIMHERSHSRLDQMSQVETGSISTRPGSQGTSVTGRREPLQPTPMQTTEKVKEPVTSTVEVASPTPTQVSMAPSRSTNFSRSFSGRAPGSPLTQRSLMTLSRISERSAHTSLHATPIEGRFSIDHRQSQQTASSPVDSPDTVGLGLSGETLDVDLPITPKTAHSPETRHAQPHQSPSSLSILPDYDMPLRVNAASKDIVAPSPRYPSIPKPLTLAASPTASQTSLSYPRIPVSNNFYRQPNPSRLNVSHTRHGSDATARTGSTSSLPRLSTSSRGPNGIDYSMQVPQSYVNTAHWSSSPDPNAANSSPHVQGGNGHVRIKSSEDPKRSADYDSQRGAENVIGVMTVPGKKNSRVLRKKSLRRMQAASSLA
jgi:hypothetical protein